ncbi:secreted sulfatase [Salmonella enterica subsp. enterica]|nr:secreted sulfatase [Salmonella enterica subsp. enterica]
MKRTVVASMIGLALCAGSVLSTAQAATAKRPNLVIILADDLGYGDLATYGHRIVKTPNIDKLAQEGVKFTDYYAPAPLCSPSRAGLLTGRMPFRTGIRSWIPEGKDVALGRNELTIANLLKQQGYDTAMMGKLHLNAAAIAPISRRRKTWALTIRWLIRRDLSPMLRWITPRSARAMAWCILRGGFVMANILAAQIR